MNLFDLVTVSELWPFQLHGYFWFGQRVQHSLYEPDACFSCVPAKEHCCLYPIASVWTACEIAKCNRSFADICIKCIIKVKWTVKSSFGGEPIFKQDLVDIISANHFECSCVDQQKQHSDLPVNHRFFSATVTVGRTYQLWKTQVGTYIAPWGRFKRTVKVKEIWKIT